VRLYVFGLAVSSAWGHDHAAEWRGLVRALSRRGHRVSFYEKDTPYHAIHRDQTTLDGGDLRLYSNWADVRGEVARCLADAGAAIVTSSCPDSRAAAAEVLASGAAVKVFYDLDACLTHSEVGRAARAGLLPEGALGGFDLVLSSAGGPALGVLERELGARRVATLYGWVDPELHRPRPSVEAYRGHLSHLGRYSAELKAPLEKLFVEPALRAPKRRFVLGGPRYPAELSSPSNVRLLPYVDPAEQAAFFASSPATLSVTAPATAERGWCPSTRLFEAAACGVPALCEAWQGLGEFFEPGREVLVVDSSSAVLEALDAREALALVGQRARARALAQHTANHRADELLGLLE
jgi:spore maturation protein CgeB